MVAQGSNVWIFLAALVMVISVAWGIRVTGPELGVKIRPGTTFKIIYKQKEAIATVARSGDLDSDCNWSSDGGWMAFSLTSNDESMKAQSVRFFFALPASREKVEIATAAGDQTGLPHFKPADTGFKAAVSTAALAFLNEKATIIKGETKVTA